MEQGTYTQRDFAKEEYINKGQAFGFTRWEKPETQSSPVPQTPGASGSPMPTYSDGQQQQQVQPASMPRRFSFNNGNFRIADSSMNSSDSGLNV